MSAKLTLCLGPAATGKTTYLLRHYRSRLAQGKPGAALWLAPTHRTAEALRSRLLDDQLDACFSPGVVTFDQFAESVLRFAQISIRPVTRLMKRQLLRTIVERGVSENQLRHFASVAGTAGFIDLLESFISELKQREVWPEQFAESLTDVASVRHRELAWLYAEYQRLLQDHQLYDAEGRFWTARALLREGQERPFEHLECLVADGFTDFTRTQREILSILSERIAEILISLPIDEATVERPLFRKVGNTLRQLRKRWPDRREIRFQADGSLSIDLRHVERRLFVPPGTEPPLLDAPSITCAKTAGSVREMEWIAREIKGLLRDGDSRHPGQVVKPDQIAVVFRSLAPRANLAREVFGQYGLPFVVDDAYRLDHFPLLATLISFLRVDTEDWPYRQLLTMLGNNYYHSSTNDSAWERSLAATERLVHELQLPRGREALLRQVRYWAERPPEPPDDGDDDFDRQRTARQRQSDARLALVALEELAQRFDHLPHTATAGSWADALRAFAKNLAFSQALEQDPQSLSAWHRLLDALEQHEWLETSLTGAGRAFSRRELVELLVDITTHESIVTWQDATGCVRLTSSTGARNLRVPYFFLAGLTEDAFPVCRDEPLVGEATVERLRSFGVEISTPEERDDEEMLLFYELVTRADCHLYLSYPALDENAESLLPSPYLEEIEQLFACNLYRDDGVRDPRPLFGLADPLRPCDARIAAVSRALDNDPELLAETIRRPVFACGDNLLAGLEIAAARANRAFGPYEGLLTSDVIAAQLAERFGPDRPWSATRLEQYAICPFRFFVQEVLRVEPLPEVVLELSAAERGRLLHQVLAAVHRRLHEETGAELILSGPQLESMQRYFDEALAQCMIDRADEPPLVQALRKITNEVVLRWGVQYPNQYSKYHLSHDKVGLRPVPAFFEVSFGMPADEATQSQATGKPLELQRNNDRILVFGRIDRIDVSDQGEQVRFNVIDYKTGRAPSAKPNFPVNGTALQLDLYTLAAQRLFFNNEAIPARAGYWNVKDQGFRAVVEMSDSSKTGTPPDVAWARRVEQVIDTVFALVRAIRRGEFPVFSQDKECTSYCPYRTACRVNQVRSLDKQWPPKSTSPR